MNISLLQLIAKNLTIIMVSVTSIFNLSNYSENQITNKNNNIEKDVPIVNQITNYKTVIEYNTKIPSNINNVKEEGQIGLSYQETSATEEAKNETIIVQEVNDKVIEQGIGEYGIYIGTMVGYGPDCIGCSTEGYTACKTFDNKKFSLKYDGIYYEDKDYGKVRIVAAATSKFPCGTIVTVIKDQNIKYNVIVLDNGGTVIKALEKGNVIMDLAYESNSLAGSDGLTGSNITFSVQRWGW